MSWVTIELGDTEYELEVTYFERAEAPSRRGRPDSWDAGSGGEVEVGDKVEIFGHNGNNFFLKEKIALTEFIKLYVEYHDIADLNVAEKKLLDEVYEDVARQVDESFDDRY